MRTHGWLASSILLLMLASRARADDAEPAEPGPAASEVSEPSSEPATTAPDAAPPEASEPAASEPAASEPELSATAPSDRAASGEAPAAQAPIDYHAVISLGFSHWFGSTFGTPAGIYTPALTVAWVPLPFLEFGVQYAASVIQLGVTPDVTSHIGFATFTILPRKELTIAGERLVFGGGPMVGVVHDVAGAGLVLGASIVARYLVQLSGAVLIGPFIDARSVLYELPGTPAPILDFTDGELRVGHADAHIQIGVAAAF